MYRKLKSKLWQCNNQSSSHVPTRPNGFIFNLELRMRCWDEPDPWAVGQGTSLPDDCRGESAEKIHDHRCPCPWIQAETHHKGENCFLLQQAGMHSSTLLHSSSELGGKSPQLTSSHPPPNRTSTRLHNIHMQAASL